MIKNNDDQKTDFKVLGVDLRKYTGGTALLVLASIIGTSVQTHDAITLVQYQNETMQAEMKELKKYIRIDIGQNMRADLEKYVDRHDAYIENKLISGLRTCRERYELIANRVDKVEDACNDKIK